MHLGPPPPPRSSSTSPDLIAKLFPTLSVAPILNLIRTGGRELLPSNSRRRQVKTDGRTGGQLGVCKIQDRGTDGRRLRRRRRRVNNAAAPEVCGRRCWSLSPGTSLLDASGPLGPLLGSRFQAKRSGDRRWRRFCQQGALRRAPRRPPQRPPPREPWSWLGSWLALRVVEVEVQGCRLRRLSVSISSSQASLDRSLLRAAFSSRSPNPGAEAS